MIGVKGVPLTASFQWARWSNSARDLRAQGATEILTDAQAAKRGYAVKAAKAYARSQSKSNPSKSA